MIKNLFFKTVFLTSLVACFYFISCNKSVRDNDNETQSSQDFTTAEFMFGDLFTQMDVVSSVQADVNRPNPPANTVASSCATVTVNPALPNPTYPKTMTLNFGTTDCIGPDGVKRRGILTIVFSGKYRTAGTVITISTNNYHINDYSVQGTETLTNMGLNSNNNPYYTENISNGIITTPTGGIIDWQAQCTREWTAGSATPIVITDDVYLIRGNITGSSTTGNTFSASILNPLQLTNGCRYVESGIVQMTPLHLSTRNIDYGSGACDNLATVTINGVNYNITLN
ncbi:MAG: hypothetical protein ABI199_04095 [Bacteroidia bacterium]